MPNFANNIFAAQELANNCATEILNAYADYENDRSSRKQARQAQADNDDYNQLVDEYNILLAKAKQIAQYHREAQNHNASLIQANTSLHQQNAALVEDNESLTNTFSQKDDEILSLKAQLKIKDQELQKAKAETEKLRETVFTFTLVNTVLSTKATALKNVLSNWREGNIYQKQSFVNALRSEVGKVDYAKNQIPTTNSIEAFAYLESNNKPLFDKLQSISF